jgi:hypothetical protein
MVIRILALFMALIFLVVSSGCSHAPKHPPNSSPGIETSPPKDTLYYYPPKEEKWWEKDENQYLIMVLIIIGVAIATGAAVAFASNGGLHIGVSK